MQAALTFLHTSTSHVERFERLRAELAPRTLARHVVTEAVLARAVEHGRITCELREIVEKEVASLATISRVILCTCSTLGPVVEQLDGKYGARVVRVDRPMASKAVRLGTRIAVVATVESTLAPTVDLLQEEAQRAELDCAVTVSLVNGAWERFVTGDQKGYLRLIGEHAARVAVEADVVVLAQASMHGAEEFVSTRVPILASPTLGTGYALELLANAGEIQPD